MLKAVTLRVSTHEAIVQIAHNIANGIDESFLYRDGIPLVFLVGGDPVSGKKIMPDETIEFFKNNYRFSKGAGAQEFLNLGLKNKDEYHGLLPAGQKPLGVSFINVLLEEDYSNILSDEEFFNGLEGLYEEEAILRTAQRFIEIHKAGDVIPNNGLAFIHNLQKQNIDYDLKLTFEEQSFYTFIDIETKSNSEFVASLRFQATLSGLRQSFG